MFALGCTITPYAPERAPAVSLCFSYELINVRAESRAKKRKNIQTEEYTPLTIFVNTSNWNMA